MVFQCFNIRQVPWEVSKIEASGLGFQHLSRKLANVNAKKKKNKKKNKNKKIDPNNRRYLGIGTKLQNIAYQ